MRGYYLMPRGWMDDREFAEEAFSRAQAWVWLIEHARFKPGVVVINARSIAVARGQLCVSLRALAETWRWSEARVRRSLTLFKKYKKIDAASDAGQTLITICDYEKFQARVDDADAAGVAAESQEGCDSDAHKKEGLEIRESIPPLTPPSQGGHSQKIRRVRRASQQSAEYVDPGVAQWRARLRAWAKSGFWPATAGPPPDDPRCYAPQNLIVEAIEQRRAQAPPRDQPQMPLPIPGGLAA